jgi:hypothetical protein
MVLSADECPVALVIQGPLLSTGRSGDGSTVRNFDCIANIELICATYGHLFDEVVIAVHDGESDSNKKRVNALGIRVVHVAEQAVYLKSPSRDNRMRQYASSLAGVRAIRASEAFVIKVRSDQMFDLAKFIDDYFSYAAAFQDFLQFGLRGPIQGLFYYPARPYSLCDYAIMGPKEALKEFYEAQFSFPAISFQLAQDFPEGDSVRKFLFHFRRHMPPFPLEALLLRIPKDLKDWGFRRGRIAVPDRFLRPWNLAVVGIFSVASLPVGNSLEIRGAPASARFSTERGFCEDWVKLRTGFHPLANARGRDLGTRRIPKLWLISMPKIGINTRAGFRNTAISGGYFALMATFAKLGAYFVKGTRAHGS